MIPADSNMAMWAVLTAIVSFGLWSERSAIGGKLTATIVVLVTAFALSNAGLIPHSAAVYGTVMSSFVPLALSLLLFRVDLREIRKETLPVLRIFAVGVFGTMLGGFVAFYVVPLGPDGGVFAGMFTATFIGGSANFAAVADSFDMVAGARLVPAVAADTIATILYLLVLGAVPHLPFVQKRLPKRVAPIAGSEQGWLRCDLDLTATMTSLFLAIGVVMMGGWVQSKVGLPGTSIMAVTVLAVALGTALPELLRPMRGGFQLGMAFMLLFFAALGANGDLGTLMSSGPVFLLFAGVVIAVHFIVIFGAAWAFDLDLAETLAASNACACGPPTAAGMAADAGWDHLITPIVLAGSLGFAIANFAGIALASLLT